MIKSIVKTKVLYKDLELEQLGKNKMETEEIHVDFRDIGAIMAGDNEDECIIFIHGRDLVIQFPYYVALALWNAVKTEVAYGEGFDS